MKPRTPPLQSTRVLDQLRERMRYMHYSLSTEQVYVYWVRFFIRWSARIGQMRHPREMGAPEVETFLSMLANDRNVSASTHNQALSAVLFLYREVLCIELPWLNDINRPTQKRRISSVLTKDEVAGLLAHMHGLPALLVRLLHGTGMRLMEGMRLRIKDVDFDRHVIIVRVATMCMKTGFNGRSKRRCRWRALPSPSRCTLCATALPPTCSNPAPTSALRRSCWATAT